MVDWFTCSTLASLFAPFLPFFGLALMQFIACLENELSEKCREMVLLMESVPQLLKRLAEAKRRAQEYCIMRMLRSQHQLSELKKFPKRLTKPKLFKSMKVAKVMVKRVQKGQKLQTSLRSSKLLQGKVSAKKDKKALLKSYFFGKKGPMRSDKLALKAAFKEIAAKEVKEHKAHHASQ